MIANLIGELICSGLCHALFAGVAGDSAVKNAQKPLEQEADANWWEEQTE